MTMLVHNKTANCYTNIEDFDQLYIGKGEKEISKTYAVIARLDNKGVAPLAFFTEEDKAIKALHDIIEWYLENGYETFEIEDNVIESILITPETAENVVNIKG